MPMSEARKRANAKYNLKAYDRVELKVSKGKKELIRQYADKNGESINAFINRAIDEAMGEAPKTVPSRENIVRAKKKDISVELL